MNLTLFITGTDTGVGKTVLSAHLARYLHTRGVRVAALKPICSGGRDDARALHTALGGALELDTINPWYFHAPIAPVLAAKRQKRSVTRAMVLTHIRQIRKQCDVLLVEGAGGLLSPLGTDFDSRDLIKALDATPIIVAANRLGAVNHIRLTLDALPSQTCRRARVVLMAPPRADSASKSNARLLERCGIREVFRFPWLGKNSDPRDTINPAAVRRVLAGLALATGAEGGRA